MSVTLFANDSEEANAYFDLVILKGNDFLAKIKNHDFVSKAVAYDASILFCIAENSADKVKRLEKEGREQLVKDLINKWIGKAKEQGHTMTPEEIESLKEKAKAQIDKMWKELTGKK